MSEIPVTPERQAAEEIIVKALKFEAEQSYIKTSEIVPYLTKAGIPLPPDRVKSASKTGWGVLHGEGGWTFAHHLATTGYFAPNERARVAFYGGDEIRKAVRLEQRRVNNMTSKIIYPRGWLVATDNEIEVEKEDKSAVSGKPVKQALKELINQANACWKVESSGHALFVEEEETTDEAGLYQHDVPVKKAFGREEEEDVIRADSSHGAIKRILDQLLLDRLKGKEMPVERTVGGVIMPFYDIRTCHMLCNTVLVSPRCFGRGGGGKPDMATRVGTPRKSLHAPVIWVADAKHEETFKLQTGSSPADDVVDGKGKVSSVATQMAHYVQPTLQWFIIHHIEEQKNNSNTNWFDEKPSLPEWMRVYGLAYTRTSIQVWVYYPCYRIIEGKVRWGYVCSDIEGWEIKDVFDETDIRPRLKLLKLLLVMRERTFDLATKLRTYPLIQAKEMDTLEALWLSGGKFTSMADLKKAQVEKNAKGR